MSVVCTIPRGRALGVSLLLAACWSCSNSDTIGNPSVGGNSSNGGSSTGGAVNGGASATGGLVSSTGGAASTGGEQATGGASTVGGSEPTGGAIATGGASTGGSVATGGKAAGGASTGGAATGGKSAGGASTGGAATGGKSAGGASTGGKSAGGASTGGAATGGSTSSSGCQKGQVAAKEVVFMGESFYALAPQYNEKRVEADAQKAGALASGATYRNVAASGQPMSYIAGTEWTQATQGGTVKVVIMDGGGIDCLNGGSCPTCASQFTTLLGKMATAGVQDVIYTRYPEPGAPPGSDANLKKCLDTVMPTMQPVCEGATGLKCHWVDLRPVFVAGDTTDGLHPTQSGGDHVGDAIWAEMVKDCIAQ
jgi:hypothetical protein